MELVSGRTYAKHRGVTHKAVQNAIRDGRITTHPGPRGWAWVNPEEADRQWRQNTDQSKPRNRITGSPKGKRQPDQPETPMDLGGKSRGGNGRDKDDVPNYSDARARRETLLAAKVQLDLEERMGTLVRAEDVRLAAFNEARKARDHLMSLPDRLSTTIAALGDPGEVHKILEDEIELICQELSGGTAEGV